MMRLLVIVFCLISATAIAEQPATALQRCGSDVGHLAIQVDDLAEQLDRAKLTIADLQKQIDDAKAAKVDEKEK